MRRGHVLVGLLVVVVLWGIEGEGGVQGDGRGRRGLLHLANERVLVGMVEGDGLGRVGLLGLAVMAVVGRLGNEVVRVSKRGGRHGGHEGGAAGTDFGREGSTDGRGA